MSDVRRDIERAAKDEGDGGSEIIKWGVGLGGGAILGTLVGRKLRKMIIKHQLPNSAMRIAKEETLRHKQRVRGAFRNRK